MNKLIFATGNSHKVEEVSALLPSAYKISSLADIDFTDEILEDGDSFEANAKIKAKAIYEIYKAPCFAEDSGLVIDSLAGEPGIYSSRYAGVNASSQDNIEKVLFRLADSSSRSAYFVSVFCLVDKDGHYDFFRGVCHGEICQEIMGKSGFGYDPIFVPKGYSKSFGEMSHDEKNAISHRFKSLSKLVEHLKSKLV